MVSTFLMPQQENASGLFAKGLDSLAQRKLDEINKRTQNESIAKALLQSGHVKTPEEAHAITQLPAEWQKEWFKSKVGGIEGGKNALAQQKQQFTEQQAITPFLHAEALDYKAQKKVTHLANQMLANIEKNKKKWPGAIVGNLPAQAQSLFIRDPNVRKYIADANSLVTQLAGTRKGAPSNFKLKLEALSKADLGMPVETQEEILKSLINQGKESDIRQKYINSLKTESGIYPGDLERKVIEFEQAQEDPLEFPQYYEEGTIYQDEESGQEYELIDGQWQEI